MLQERVGKLLRGGKMRLELGCQGEGVKWCKSEGVICSEG